MKNLITAFAFLFLVQHTSKLKAQDVKRADINSDNYDKLGKLSDDYGCKLWLNLKIKKSNKFIPKLDFSDIICLEELWMEFDKDNGFQEKIFTEISKIDSINKLYIIADSYEDIKTFISLCNNSQSLPNVNEFSLTLKNAALIDSLTLFPGTKNFNVRNICDIVNFNSSNNLEEIACYNHFGSSCDIYPNFVWVDTNVELISVSSVRILDFIGPTSIRPNLRLLLIYNDDLELSIKLSIDFKNLPNIEELYLKAPHLSNTLNNISNCTKLNQVQIDNIDDAWQTLDSLSLCKNLTYLSIGGDIKKKKKYELIQSFKSLKDLTLDMDFVPKQLFKYTPELIEINFSNRFNELPKGLKQCKKLTSVIIPFTRNINSLKNIPKDITHLTINDNRNLNLLKEIKRFKNLKTLDIQLNDLRIVNKKKNRIELIDALLSKMPSLNKIKIEFPLDNYYYSKEYPKYIWPDMKVLIKKYPNVTFEYNKTKYEMYYQQHKNYYDQLN